MSDPHLALLRALMERAGAGAQFIEGKAWEWATATFAGHRHLFRIALPDAAVADLAAGLDAAPIALAGHLVADLAATGHGDGIAEITALTITQA